jgi:methionyl-tRNA formyltransferase
MRTVLLLGIGPTASSALKSLANKFEIIGIVRDIDPSMKPSDEVGALAGDLGLRINTDTGLESIEAMIRDGHPDCTVVSSFNRILPTRILELGRFVNVHYAPLPAYRGRANVNWAIVNGEDEAAISIHTIVPGLDAGNILYQERIPIGPFDTATDLYARLNDIQYMVLGDTVSRYLDGDNGVPQNEESATYGCTRLPRDGEIDWGNRTIPIFALIRALSPPFPGAHTYLDTQRLTVVRAEPLEDAPRYVGRVPGRIVGRSRTEGHVDVLTGDGILRIHEVRTGDGQVCTAARVITSTRQTLGLSTADLLQRIDDLTARLDKLEERRR